MAEHQSLDNSLLEAEANTSDKLTSESATLTINDQEEPSLVINSNTGEEQHIDSVKTPPTSPHHLTIITPSAGAVSSSESISEEEYLEKLHEKYSQTPSSELGISSFSTFGSMNTTYFHTDTTVSTDTTLTPKKDEEIVTHDFVDLCYQSTVNTTNSCEDEDFIISPEDDEALDLLVGTGMTVVHSSEPAIPINTEAVDEEITRSTSQPPKVPPPFNSKKNQYDIEKVEMSKFHLPPVPTFKKKPPPLQTHHTNISTLATPSPPSSLKLIMQQYNILHHNVVHLTLSNKNQKIIVPMINSNVTVLARSASLASSLTSLFEEKVQVRVFQNGNTSGTDDIYLSTQSGMQRITALELDCKNPVLCLKSLEDILFFSTVLPLSNFQVEQVVISNSTTQAIHQFHKVIAKDPQESQIVIFATDTHIEIPLTSDDKFIIEDIGRLTAFEETLSVCPHGEHYIVRGPGVFWLKTEIII